MISAAACSGDDGGPEADLRISEILYHPVDEQAFDDVHEWVELANVGATDVDLGGWRLTGETVALDLPTGTVVPAGGFLVLAKDRARVAATWGLDPAIVAGDFAGNLDNGDDTLRLLDPAGVERDRVTYGDNLPWPVAADALGAGEKWLRPELLPLAAHRDRGVSLERVNLMLPADDPANWVPSPVDGATPGAANAGAAEQPDAIVLALDRVGAELGATVSAHPGLTAVELEWFIDDVAVTGEATARVAMRDAGAGRWVATLPVLPDNTIVRYRIAVDTGAGLTVISPRPSDPFDWHAIAQVPTVATTTKVYHLYIAPSAWGQMWTSLNGGRDSGCTVSTTWNDEVSAVLVADGEVYDVRARYQGSRYNRVNGPQLPAWPYPGPDAGPSPPRALSWHLSLPRYHRLDGRGTIVLNKNTQGCPGYDAGVGFALFQQVGVPAARTNYARLHINGGYYHYMMEYERPGEDLLKRYGPVGRLYKSVGQNGDGAYGWGDERTLGPACGLSAADRYALTYDEKTHEWADHADLIALIEDLGVARAAGPAALRQFFADRFDLSALLNYYAVMNWSVPFDDMFQNHFLYHRRDGRWILMPWDLDRNFGGWKGAQASLYIGEEGDPDNRSGWWNLLKDGFLKSYRRELEVRMRELVNTGPLTPANVAARIDAVTASVSAADAAAAPAGLSCDLTGRAASFRQFAIDRQAVVNARVAP